MKTILFTLILFTQYAGASVWKANNSWNMSWEKKYSTWISSDNVHRKLFSDKNSPYYGAWLDCADASYAIRAIFSFENSLPFAVESLKGARHSRDFLVSNESKRFDRVKNKYERVVKMLNHIGGSVGTENLSRYDTFPIKLSSIKAGDLFLYKILRRFNKTIRHSYNIKKVNYEGTFQVIYSTQAIAKEKAPMTLRKHKVFSNLPFASWGFRRFKWPRLIGLDLADYPKELQASQEQYDLADQMSSSEFFEYVRNIIKSGDLNINQEISNRFDSLCEEAQARIKYVDQAIRFMDINGSRCMNYQNYDAYSTPARDKQLKNAYLSYYKYYQTLVATGDVSKLNKKEKSRVLAIFENKDDVSNDLLNACPIKYTSNKKISLKTLWSRIQNGKVSSHPNDILEVRWGEAGPITSCKIWYAPMMIPFSAID